MSDTNTFKVKHKCRHTVEHDLSDKPVGDRQGFAGWLATRDCTGCWRMRQPASALPPELAKARADESAVALEFQRQQELPELPELQGSLKQIGWAVKVRYEMILKAYEDSVSTGLMDKAYFAQRVLVPARGVTQAKWWIDHREADTDQLTVLLSDPGRSARGRGE